MKINLKLLLTLAFFLLVEWNAGAQIAIKSKDTNLIQYTQITSQSKRVYDDEMFHGDVYLYDNWKSAEFTLPDETKLIIDSIKFNLLRGHVEVYLKGKHFQLSGNQYNSFQFTDFSEEVSTYKSKHYYFDNGLRLSGIVKTIEIGDASVLVAYKAGIRKVSDDNPLMLEKLKKDIVRITKLRYIEKEGKLTRIKNKKDLHKYFGSSKNIKNFISKQDLNHKEEHDIAKLIAYASNLEIN